MSNNKKTIAVFFGGKSPEHDVSIVSGLQVLNAIDTTLYNVFPVYVTTDGKWLTGDLLKDRGNYMLSREDVAQCDEVTLRFGAKIPTLVSTKSSLFSKNKTFEFDIAFPVFHGLYGEDGNMQGVFETAGAAYVGPRTMASSILMDKKITKYMLAALDIPYLPYAIINQPGEGYLINHKTLEHLTKDLKWPLIVKPVHLGSSIGVAKVNDIKELGMALPAIFSVDNAAIVEPFVENLVEYNIAVSKIGTGGTILSAIERPKNHEELLDFKTKYLSGGDGGKNGKAGTKSAGTISQGMLSLTRELNPDLPQETKEKIKDWSRRIFNALDGAGAPRIDYISNGSTGEIWLNEVNPMPGSVGYFLWEAAPDPLLFTEFLSFLIDESTVESRKTTLDKDPVPLDAQLFKRKT